MSDVTDTDRIISDAIASVAKRQAVRRVMSEPSVDMDGHEAISVTLVVDPKIKKLDGDDALDIIVKIQRGLQDAGDQRFAVVEFVTEDELA